MDLRNVLQSDMVGSGISVVVAILGAFVLGDWLGVSPWIPFGVGVALIPWVAFLAFTTRQSPPRRWQVGIVAGGNLAWAVAAGVILIGFPDALSGSGRWIVGVFSAAVLAFGVAQAFGLKDLD